MDANQVQKSVGRLFSNHNHHFLNRYIFGSDWECDFFSVTNSGYLYEVEVKISKSDYIADFKKFKHKLFEGRNETSVIKEAKYKKLKKRTIRMSPEKSINPQTVQMPNKFFFACPEGLLTVDEIPEYAGLIYVSEFSATVVKQAPFIHKRKEDIKELLFSKYQWGYINAIEDIDKLKKKCSSMSSKFDVMCRSLEKEFKLKEGSVTSFAAFKRFLKDK